MAAAGPFKSKEDQAARARIVVPSNTTLIGVGSDARIVNGYIQVKNADNVVIRNLTLAAPCDIDPKWDAGDGASGNWNAAYDGLVVDNSRHVWVDHNTFTDAPMTDDKLPVVNGKIKQCHDGALDVKNGSDFVTVSNNVFTLHEKNTIIGHSDDTAAKDEGHLKVTFHGNHYKDISGRTPRVRFGQVHLYNNYHEGQRSSGVYRHGYSVGVGYKAKIISQNNVYEIGGASGCGDIVTNPGSSSKTGAMRDSGSLLNGNALGLGGSSCKFSTTVGWELPYTPALLAAPQVKASVLANAGAGKLNVR
jgi:pectate lyase